MYEYPAKCVKVVDGDTVKLEVDIGFGITKKDTFRLKDIDTPEIYRPSCDAELQHGREAKQFVQDQLRCWIKDDDRAAILLVHTHKDKQGKFGRYLCDIYYKTDDGLKSLVEELKRNGFEKRESYVEN